MADFFNSNFTLTDLLEQGRQYIYGDDAQAPAPHQQGTGETEETPADPSILEVGAARAQAAYAQLGALIDEDTKKEAGKLYDRAVYYTENPEVVVEFVRQEVTEHVSQMADELGQTLEEEVVAPAKRFYKSATGEDDPNLGTSEPDEMDEDLYYGVSDQPLEDVPFEGDTDTDPECYDLGNEQLAARSNAPSHSSERQATSNTGAPGFRFVLGDPNPFTLGDYGFGGLGNPYSTQYYYTNGSYGYNGYTFEGLELGFDINFDAGEVEEIDVDPAEGEPISYYDDFEDSDYCTGSGYYCSSTGITYVDSAVDTSTAVLTSLDVEDAYTAAFDSDADAGNGLAGLEGQPAPSPQGATTHSYSTGATDTDSEPVVVATRGSTTDTEDGADPFAEFFSASLNDFNEVPAFTAGKDGGVVAKATIKADTDSGTITRVSSDDSNATAGTEPKATLASHQADANITIAPEAGNTELPESRVASRHSSGLNLEEAHAPLAYNAVTNTEITPDARKPSSEDAAAAMQAARAYTMMPGKKSTAEGDLAEEEALIAELSKDSVAVTPSHAGGDAADHHGDDDQDLVLAEVDYDNIKDADDSFADADGEFSVRDQSTYVQV